MKHSHKSINKWTGTYRYAHMEPNQPLCLQPTQLHVLGLELINSPESLLFDLRHEACEAVDETPFNTKTPKYSDVAFILPGNGAVAIRLILDWTICWCPWSQNAHSHDGRRAFPQDEVHPALTWAPDSWPRLLRWMCAAVTAQYPACASYLNNSVAFVKVPPSC